MTRSDEPSGATSQRRTATSACGRSTSSSSDDLADARGSRAARASGSKSHVSETRVLDALVAGEVGRPALRAPDARLDPARLHAEERARTAAELAAPPWRCSATATPARPPSARRAPRRSCRGAAESCIQARSIGSSMIPVSMPLSQWSHQRTHSWRKPMLGPGSASSGNACAHGPMRPLRGTESPSSSRGTAFV